MKAGNLSAFVLRNFSFICFCFFLLYDCHSRPDPGATVEVYLQAKVAGDAHTIQMLLCAELEHTWEREVHAFETVDGVHLEGVDCQALPSSSGDERLVDCQGQIVALYGGEQRVFPLGTYRLVWQAGEWRWCGEAR